VPSGMPDKIRRIVTGHNDKAEAVVKIDEVMEPEVIRGAAALFTKVWTTDTSPADNNDDFDGAERETGLVCPGGTVLRFVDMPPGSRSPLHRTESMDYGIVLAGQVKMELDGGERVPLKPGDVVVQRGATHAWINAGEDWARMVFSMTDAIPATVGGNTLGLEYRD
jgi:quercetin dioxygenase-like cupin family protein